MKRIFTFLFVFFAFLNIAYAQESIYWVNGNRFSFRLIGANEDQVFYAAQQDGQMEQRSYSRDNVLIIFNARGRYLMVSEISKNSTQAKQQLEEFYRAPGAEHDLLIKAVPLTLIPCKISYKSDDVINYISTTGTPASINQRELVAIIYRDGKHSFNMPVQEAATLLSGIAPEIQKLFTPVVASSNRIHNANTSENLNSTSTKPPTQTDEFKVNYSSLITLTNEELSNYKQKSLQKIDEFVSYLNIITDKKAEANQKNTAVEQASKLFLPDAMIEVSSNTTTGVRKYTISAYLNRLKLLPYSSAKVEWHEVSFVKDLTQAADGNYYGTISGQQTFTGYGPNGKNVLYSDITEKNVKVKLQHYQKSVSGQQQISWEVLLGNIGITVR